MTINPTTTTPSATTSTTPSSGTGQTSQTLGKDAFMQLLVTKMRNQDPTQPQDDSALLAQLAQFSSLEQMEQMNTTLTGISDFFTQSKAALDAASTGTTSTTKS
jgi:flagellar basal-body rod modification protein FlgD